MFFILSDSWENTDKIYRLYESYSKYIYSVAYAILKDKHLSEDAVHETLIRISDHLDKIDESDVVRTKAFLSIVCRNTAIDIAKKSTYLNDDGHCIYYVSNEDVGIEANPSEILSTRETTKVLTEALDSLDPKYRDAFLLKYAYKYSREEIAGILNISVEAVKKRIERAKKKLAEYLIKEGIIQ